jgi:hypothetical protein
MTTLGATRRTTVKYSVRRDRTNMRSETICILGATPERSGRRSRVANAKTPGQSADHASWSRRMNWM